MSTWVAAIALALHAAADAGGLPPVVGRPVDFSSAVGGPFVVQWIAEPTNLAAEEPVTLALRIAGPGNLQDLARPALGTLASFKAFAVEDLDDRFVPGDPPRREFRYRVRPRSAVVKEIPRFKFVYFNPRIMPPSRGYQTTYADAVPLTVKPRTPLTMTVPAEAPEWLLEPPASEEFFGPPPKLWQEWLDGLREKMGMTTGKAPGGGEWLLILLALLIPPALCGAWLAIWRRLNPDAARLAAGRRSRATAVALRALGRAGTDQADLVAAALAGYLRDHTGLPTTANTPTEIAAGLIAFECPSPLAGATVALFQRCDAARFGPAAADAALATDAAKIILEWEAAAWAGPAC